MAKLGLSLPRTFSNAFSRDRDDPSPFYIQNRIDTGTDPDMDIMATDQLRRRRLVGSNASAATTADSLPQRVVRIGRSVIRMGDGEARRSRTSSRVAVPLSTAVTTTTTMTATAGQEEGGKSAGAGDGAGGVEGGERQGQGPPQGIQRTIRFPDEETPGAVST